VHVSDLKLVSEAHLRLSAVTVENLPYGDIITRYDRPGTFFYIDPPYYGYEDYYGKDVFGRADFALLAGILKKISGSLYYP
jgi:DNA adenine methylase